MPEPTIQVHFDDAAITDFVRKVAENMARDLVRLTNAFVDVAVQGGQGTWQATLALERSGNVRLYAKIPGTETIPVSRGLQLSSEVQTSFPGLTTSYITGLLDRTVAELLPRHTYRMVQVELR